MNIVSYADFLSPDDFATAVQLTRYSSGWNYTGQSNKEGFTFWYLDLMSTPFFTEHVASIIREKTKLDFVIDRVYANGQTYGLCGSVHLDRYPEEGDNFLTFLLYTHPRWQLVWGGNTVLYDEENKQEISIPPKPNHAILFDSTIPHVGLEPTRHCQELRTSVAYKLSLIER